MGIRMDSLPPRYQKQAARKLDPVAYEKALQFFHAEESAKNPARQAQGSISRAAGKPYPKTQQVARCGNAVCPPMAAAVVAANLPEYAMPGKIETMAALADAVAM